MRRTVVTLVCALATLSLASVISAQQPAAMTVPNLIRYGGTLKDVSGAPIAATAGVTFAIYKQQDGGAPVWIETQNVTPDASGQYSVLLGSTTATGLPSDLFSQDEQRWLGVQVQGQAEQPRVLLVSVPYAFKAHEAETLGGKSISDFVLAKDANSSTSGASGTRAGFINRFGLKAGTYAAE
jgi:trimeric autotransporter adhesin